MNTDKNRTETNTNEISLNKHLENAVHQFRHLAPTRVSHYLHTVQTTGKIVNPFRHRNSFAHSN